MIEAGVPVMLSRVVVDMVDGDQYVFVPGDDELFDRNFTAIALADLRSTLEAQGLVRYATMLAWRDDEGDEMDVPEEPALVTMYLTGVSRIYEVRQGDGSD